MRLKRARTVKHIDVCLGRAASAVAALALCLWAAPSLAQKAYIPNGDNSISVIDTAAGQLVGTIVTGGGLAGQPAAVAITPDGSTALVAESGTRTLAVVALSSGQVTAQVSVGNAPDAVAVAPDGRRLSSRASLVGRSLA
jgi:DNA-binding beta-propeller fold protein YncE